MDSDTMIKSFCMWCGEAHLGAQCPDGLVICCLCHYRYSIHELNVTEDGKLEDVCIYCAEDERHEMVMRGMR